jgi:hypothetical protein
MVQKRALLLAKMDPPESKVKEFNDWYNNTHVAARSATPGFLSACRFTKIGGIPKAHFIAGDAGYLALYDLTNAKVLKDRDYRDLCEKEASLPKDSFETLIFKLPNFTRAVYEQIFPVDEEYINPQSRYVFVVGHDVPENRHEEFNAWYNTEHIPALLSVPGFIGVRRFKLAEKPIVQRGGSVSEYLTLWDVEGESALTSDAFMKAANSPWSDWVRSWYTRKMCSLYRLIFPEQ